MSRYDGSFKPYEDGFIQLILLATIVSFATLAYLVYDQNTHRYSVLQNNKTYYGTVCYRQGFIDVYTDEGIVSLSPANGKIVTKDAN